MSEADDASPATNAPNSRTGNNRSQARPYGRNRRQQSRPVAVNGQAYAGENEDIGYVLAMRSEKFEKKVPFQIFVEKIATYVVSNLKDGGDIQTIFLEMKDPSKTFNESHKPIKPEKRDEDEDIDEVDLEIYREEVKQFVQRKMNMRRNVEKSYGLVWGQCSNGLQTYIKGLSSYDTQARIFDLLWLLRELKKATSGIDDRSNTYVSMHEAIANLYRMKQAAQETNDHYLARFRTNINAVELAGGAHLFFSPELAGYDETMTEEDKEVEVERSKAIILLKCSDDLRYGPLSEKLQEGTYLDRDEYPKSIAMMYELMTKCNASIQQRNSSSSYNSRRRGAITLVQQGTEEENDLIPGTDGRTHDILCFNCNRRGHYASNCPEPSTRVGVSNLQVGHMLTQDRGKHGLIPEEWILLDTCSTDNVINDVTLVQNMRKCGFDETLTIHTNGGELTYREIGDFKFLPIEVFYNPKSIANVLSLKAVDNVKGFHIEMNTSVDPFINVIKGNHKLRFMHSDTGLFYCTVDNMRQFHEDISRNSKSISLLSTKKDHNTKYTPEEIDRANEVRALQKCMLWPSTKAMRELLNNPMRNNSILTTKDLHRALEIYGEPLEILAGKMTAPSMKRNDSQQILLSEIKEGFNKRVKLYVDIFFVNGIPFLHTKSKDTNYITIQKLQNRKSREIRKKLKLTIAK